MTNEGIGQNLHLTAISENDTVPDSTVISRTEQKTLDIDDIGKPLPSAEEEQIEVERTCAALNEASEKGCTVEDWKEYVELHKAAVKKHGDNAITQTMKKYRKPPNFPRY